MKLTILFVVVVGASLFWWLRSVKSKRAALSVEVSLQPQQPLGDKVKEYSTDNHHADHHYRN
jgi:hypothetical protein